MLEGKKKEPLQVKMPPGLYMWGGVGVGKTMLMDLLVQCAPSQFKACRAATLFFCYWHGAMLHGKTFCCLGDARMRSNHLPNCCSILVYSAGHGDRLAEHPPKLPEFLACSTAFKLEPLVASLPLLCDYAAERLGNATSFLHGWS